MSQSDTGAATTPDASSSGVAVTCRQCHAQFRVRSFASLKPGAKSTCAGCGTRFHVVACETAEPSTAAPSTLPPAFQASDATAARPYLLATTTPRGEQASLDSDGTLRDGEQAPPPGTPGADPAAPTRPPAPKTYRLSFSGSGRTLFGIHIVNVCLTLITLTIYSFWAKVRVRKFLYSQSAFAGDRFAYHGTGRELMNGATKATLVFGIPYLALSNAPQLMGGSTTVIAVSQILSVLLALTFLPVAIVGARRYRLSRSSWRGIRFSFHGQAAEFMKLYIPHALLAIVTLGATYPLLDMKRQAYLVRHSALGTERFSFDGQDWGVAKSFLWAVVLFPVTFGLSWFWYSAARQRYVWNHTQLGGARFSCTMQGADLAKLRVTNFLLLVCTLGFAWPWTTIRNAHFTLNTLTLRGVIDFDRIAQQAQTCTATGEGLSSFLDSGFDLG
ncbi:MAG: DUF898 family protein [Nitrospiraceae bacterium]